jgi:hypothetical protein
MINCQKGSWRRTPRCSRTWSHLLSTARCRPFPGQYLKECSLSRNMTYSCVFARYGFEQASQELTVAR